MPKINRKILDQLYVKYNRREYVHPDPLEFLYLYNDSKDREIVGLIASSLAYGRVAQILKSVEYVLERMDPSPAFFLKNATLQSLQKAFTGFNHRFATAGNLAMLLLGVKRILMEYGSLYQCFMAGAKRQDRNILPALSCFAGKLTEAGDKGPGHLIPLPERGSACKRLNLFLRWMVRKDDVDMGGWEDVSPSKLIVPLDTHMHRICLSLGFTARKQADMRTALEITDSFSALIPDDPVKYDFALTRLGIRNDTDLEGFLSLSEGGKLSLP